MMLLQPRTQEALRASPSAGWVGRRDRAVLVLSKMAGMSDEDIAGLIAGDVVIADAAATITAATGTITLPASDDSMICGPCALARWLHLLDMTVIYPDRYVIDAVIARAAPLSADSPHLCRGTHAVTDTTRHLLLLPPIDRWGPISAIPAQRGPRNRRQPYAPGHGARPAATDHQAAETCWATERYATGNPTPSPGRPRSPADPGDSLTTPSSFPRSRPTNPGSPHGHPPDAPRSPVPLTVDHPRASGVRRRCPAAVHTAPGGRTSCPAGAP